MTEIQSGNSFSVSSRFMQEMHKAASDNSVDAKEIAQLVKIASEDAAGLTDDEKNILTSVFTKKLDTSGLTPEEKTLFDKLRGSNTSQEVADQNIQALKSIINHENDPNSLNFSKLNLVSESKDLLSKASFGLFGGTNKTAHGITLYDGNLPRTENPTQTTNMTDRREIDRNNLISMLGPLDQELKTGLAPDSDVRKRLGESLGLDPNSEEVTTKIKGLSDKITAFKRDPSKADWTASSDLTALMNSYAQNPPTDNPRINSAYMSSLLGTFWNAWDATSLENEQKVNQGEGNIQVPASLEEINKSLDSVNNLAKTDTEAALEKANTLLAQLDQLKETNPALYEKVLRGKDESAVNLLRDQVSALQKHLQEGGAMGQAQMAQLNNIYANVHQLQKTIDIDLPSSDVSELEAQASTSALPTGSQEQLDALKTAMGDAKSALANATSAAQESTASRSNMINDLQQAESTLANLLTQHGISDTGRAQLQDQLDATRAALSQLKNNQDVKFEKPEQQEAFSKVLQNLQKMKPAPAVSSNPVGTGGSLTNLSALDPATVPLLGQPPAATAFPDFNLGLPPINGPAPYSPSFTDSSAWALPDPTLSWNAFSGSSQWDNSSLLYSPSFNSGGYSCGLGNYNLGTPLLSLPSMNPSPSPDTATAPRPSMSNVFLEGAGVDPANVKPLSPEQEQRQAEALKTIAAINANGSPEAKEAAKLLEKLVNNPSNAPIQLDNGQTLTPPPGSFESSLAVLESYQELTNKGIAPQDAEAVFVLAARLVQKGESPENIKTQVQQIASSGSKEQITAALQDFRVRHFVGDQQTVARIADRLDNSELAKSLATNVLGADFIGQVQKLEGGANVKTVEEAVQFLQTTGKDTSPSYIVQVMQSPNFNTHYTKVLDTAKTDLQSLNSQATALINEINSKNMVKTGQVKTIDEAIIALGRSSAPGASEMLLKLQELKTKQTQLAPQIAGIEQLKAVNTNYQTVKSELTKAIAELEKLPQNDPRRAEVAMLKTVLTELETTGQLSPTSAADFADFKFKRRMNTAEAVLNADPQQTEEGGNKVRRIFGLLRTGTPAQKDAAVTELIQGFTSGTIRAPHNLAKQNELLSALELPTSETQLSFEALMERLGRFQPSQVISSDIDASLTMADAMDIARSQLTGKPPAAEIPILAQGRRQESMTYLSDPDRLTNPTNPTAVALSRYDEATEVVRNHNYSLPPEQRAAAWQNTLTDYQASDAIIDHMDQNIAKSLQGLSQANDKYMVANGYPPLSSNDGIKSVSPGAKLSPKAQELVDKADALANALLSPIPKGNGKEYLSDLLGKFLTIIRDLDFKTRQLVLKQLAQKMVNNAITQFYKDKLDENNKHHQEALQRLQVNLKAQITQMLETSLANNSNSTQGVASMSGQVTGSALATAFDQVDAQSPINQMFEITDKMTPPLSNAQKQSILSQLALVMAAAGTPDINDDRMALQNLNSDLSTQRFNR